MPDYRVDAKISVRDGPWEPYTTKNSDARRDPPSARKAAADIKHIQSRLRGISETEIRIRKTTVTPLD